MQDGGVGRGKGEVGKAGGVAERRACKLQTVHEFNPGSSYRHRFTSPYTSALLCPFRSLRTFSFVDLIINSAFKSGYITITANPDRVAISRSLAPLHPPIFSAWRKKMLKLYLVRPKNFIRDCVFHGCDIRLQSATQIFPPFFLFCLILRTHILFLDFCICAKFWGLINFRLVSMNCQYYEFMCLLLSSLFVYLFCSFTYLFTYQYDYYTTLCKCAKYCSFPLQFIWSKLQIYDLFL